MKPVYIKWSTYIGFNKENNKEDPKFRVKLEHMIMLKIMLEYQNIKPFLRKVTFHLSLKKFL